MLRQAVTEPGAGAWPRVPPEDVQLMLPGLEQVAEEMIEAIQLGVPEYARPQNDTYMASVRQAVTHAVGEFVERLANPDVHHDRAAQVFRNIGRSEAAEGRSLEPLQMALRVGARVARRLHVHPQTARYRMRQLYLLFGDELHEPDARFELEIALRAQLLLGPTGQVKAKKPG